MKVFCDNQECAHLHGFSDYWKHGTCVKKSNYDESDTSQRILYQSDACDDFETKREYITRKLEESKDAERQEVREQDKEFIAALFDYGSNYSLEYSFDAHGRQITRLTFY